MTEREIILRNVLLAALADQASPRTEAFFHARVHAALGTKFSAAEVSTAFQQMEKARHVTGLPNSVEQMEWRITSEGRHHLIQ